MRSFIALPVSDPLSDALTGLQYAVQTGRAVPPDNLHLTLAFLEDQPVEMLEALDQELLCIRAAPFEVAFTGMGAFGRAVHVTADPTPALRALHDQVVSACRRAGLVLPRRRFRPHVTIIRLNHSDRVLSTPAVLAAHQLPVMPVSSFALYQSTLLPGGARHDVLATYPLG